MVPLEAGANHVLNERLASQEKRIQAASGLRCRRRFRQLHGFEYRAGREWATPGLLRLRRLRHLPSGLVRSTRRNSDDRYRPALSSPAPMWLRRQWRSISQFGSWLLPPTRAGLDHVRQYIALRRSDEFDAHYYLERYPDVAAADLNPLMHYVEHGVREGRQPKPRQVGPRPTEWSSAALRENREANLGLGLHVDETIAPADAMFQFAPSLPGYLAVGRSALQQIELARKAVDAHEPSLILDLPCGHGRVLRFLRARWPEATIVACDLDQDGVDFCTRHFGARGVYSADDPRDIDLGGEAFDLIWVGSLFTHLPAQRWQPFLDKLTRVLAPDGLLLFTVSGRFVADRLAAGRKAYDREGFAYEASGDRSEWGRAVSSPEWVMRLLARYPQRVLSYAERRWNDHQDVVALWNRDILAGSRRSGGRLG
jgi:SAM-dependent methyltransferase